MLKDVQYAYRTLRQHPGFAITAIISIAIGIGANSAIFSFQDGLLLRPLAIKDAANVVSVRSQNPTGDFGGFSYPDFQELRDKNTEHFFGTLRMPILAGRGFLPSDRADSPNVAVVNEAFAQRFFAGNAVGKRVRIESLSDATSEIIGVTANAKFQTPVQQAVPFIFVPVAQHPRSRLSLITETSGDPVAMATPIRELIRSLNPNMPVFAVRTIDNIFERGAAAQLRLFNEVFSASGVMGFFLALVGLYGVVAHQVTRRTREIGVRMALGAERLDVLRMILKQAGIVAGIGVIIGLVLSLAARAALLTSLGQRTTSFDSFVLVIVPLGLLMTTLIAAAIPARRASRIDPQQALRQD